jgi:hypothetical protein
MPAMAITKEQFLDEQWERRFQHLAGHRRTEDGFEWDGGHADAAECACGEEDCRGWQLRLELGGTARDGYQPDGGEYPQGQGPGHIH